MPTLKYLDPTTGTYKALPGIVGPQGPKADLGVVIEPLAYGNWYRSTNQAIPNNAATQVIFDTINYSEPVGMTMDYGTGTVTIQDEGLYAITAHMGFVANATGQRYAFLYAGTPPNGTSMGRTMGSTSTASAVYTGIVVAHTRYMKVGDIIRLVAYQSSGANLDLLGDGVNRNIGLEVTKIQRSYSGSAVSTYGERAYSTTRRSVVAQSFTTATTQTVTWEVVDDDNGIPYNTSTGEFTVPVTGYYDVSAAVHFATGGATGNRVILIYVNGGVKAAAQMGASSTGGTSPTISRTVLLNAGDLVKIYAGQGSGATVALTTSSAYNWVTITKVPAPVVNGQAASAVWGAAPLNDMGSDSLIGQPVYVDSAGQLRAVPQTFTTSQKARFATDLAGTYPLGLSITQMTGAQSTAGGWPEGVSGSVVTFRRSGETDANACASQWYYATTSVTPRAYYRSGSGTGAANAWSPWFYFGMPMELAGSVDLNTVTTTGTYTQSQTADAGTGTNYPVPLAGMLEVTTNNSNMVWQRYTVYFSGLPSVYPYGNVYTRGYYQGTWYPWRTVLPTDTGWVNIDIVAGFAALAGATPQVRRIDKTVYIRGAWANTGMSTGGSYGVGIIPAGFLPTYGFYAPVGTNSGNVGASSVIGAGAGDSIQIRPGATLATGYYPQATWLID